MSTLLLDADITAYKFAAAAQQSIDFGDGLGDTIIHSEHQEVFAEVDKWIEELIENTGADRLVACLSCPAAENFRYGVYPLYKHNRAKTQRPVLLPVVREYIAARYETFMRPTLEGDDVMGILATSAVIIKDEKIIVSEDKDMRSVPGLLFNPAKMDAPEYISRLEADLFFYTQVLTGDPTDGYPGCPGIGKVKAQKVLEGLTNEHDMWQAIVATYATKGLTEDDALTQARCARILRSGDYDFKNKKVKLWTPTPLTNNVTAQPAPTSTSPALAV